MTTGPAGLHPRGPGIRQPLSAHVSRRAELRLLETAFMTIRQAMGTTRERRPQTAQFLDELVTEPVTSGFVAEALRRSGRDPTLTAPHRGLTTGLDLDSPRGRRARNAVGPPAREVRQPARR